MDKNWKELYEELVYRIHDIRKNAELLRDDMRDNGLTASTIEAEGYLRCAIVMCNQVERTEEALNSNIFE